MRATRNNVSTIHFFTREGIVFQQYYDLFAAAAQLPQQSALVHVSRLSTFCASLVHSGVTGLDRFFSQYSDASLDQVLTSLQAHPLPAGIAAKLSGVSAQGHALRNMLASAPPCENWLRKLATLRHDELHGYLTRHHPELLGARNAVVVDIGWRGTIQDNLALTFPDTHWHGVYLGLYPFLNPQPGNVDKIGLLFAPSHHPDHVHGDNLLPIEYLFGAEIGSVTGYCNGDPVLAPCEPGPANSFARSFQAHLMTGAAHCGQILSVMRQQGREAEQLATWRRSGEEFWEQCQAMGPELFAALRCFRHDESFGVAASIRIDDVLSLKSMLRSLVSPATRRLFIQHSLAIPAPLRQSAELRWWLRGWYAMQPGLRWINRLRRMKDPK